MAFAAGAILALVSAGRAASPETTTGRTMLRSGNHADFGRIVIETSGRPEYRVEQDGDAVVIRFADDVLLGSPPTLPRNVTAIRTDRQTVELTLQHGALVHSMRMDGRVIIDVLDARDDGPKIRRPAPVPEAKLKAAPALSMASSPELGGRSSEVWAPAPAELVRPAVEAKPVAPAPAPKPVAAAVPTPPMPEVTRPIAPGREVMPENEAPVGLLARRAKLPKGADGSAFVVPFDSTTGAASFRIGSNIYIVFDERRPVDMVALRNDPVFAAASVQLLPNGTLFRIPLPPAQSVALTQTPLGWRIAAVTATPKQQPIAATYVDGRLNLAAELPGDVVSLANPDTGAALLVGTQHRPGQGVSLPRGSTEFIMHSTLQGVLIEPLSDAIVLKPVPTGFALTGNLSGLALSSPSSLTETMMDAARLTRRLDISSMPAEALMRRASKQLNEAANASPMRRGRKHHAVAESFLALGLAAEAESLLHMASAQDPSEAASPDTGALTAIAALLAGRVEEADALTDPRLDGTDEIALWRAIRQAMRDEGSPAAAAVFAATAPMAFQYPPPVRERILPLMAETMIQGGEINLAARLLEQSKGDPKLAYARALMRQAEGETDQALDMLDALANGHDQFDRARAAIRAVELRLAARKFDNTRAADELDKLLYAWRGDSRELALRQRIAELRGQTGAWRVALATLRQAEADFPEQAAQIHARLKDMFGGMIRDQGNQHMSPIEFVAMVDENTDLVPEAGEDDAVDQSLADRLLALDLPGRAKSMLEKLVKSAKSPAAKARYGTSLAALEVRAGNDAEARVILDASDSPDLPPEVVEQRTILRAGSVARSGDPAAGASMLAPVRTANAIEARAQIWENANDWAAAAQAWADDVAVTLPESGMLDEAQTQMALRLATATARAGNDAGLGELRIKFGGRIGAGPLADMFRLLTAEPVRTTSDIKRSNEEMSLAASLPKDLKALMPGRVVR